MISAARKTSRRSRSGFTILEIVVVLSIAMLIVGGGLGALYFNRDEAALLDASEEIEVLAKRARTIATLKQQPYGLEFTATGVALMPYAEATISKSDRVAFLAEREEIAAQAGDSDAVKSVTRSNWKLEEGMRLSVKRWASTDWLPLKRRDEVQVWRFDPEGICEPVSVRIDLGEGWIMMRFHPLTAAIAESEMEIP